MGRNKMLKNLVRAGKDRKPHTNQSTKQTEKFLLTVTYWSSAASMNGY